MQAAKMGYKSVYNEKRGCCKIKSYLQQHLSFFKEGNPWSAEHYIFRLKRSWLMQKV